MKYTRYDLKRKERTSNCFLLCLIGVLIGSVLIGTVISKLFFENINSTIANKNKNYNVDSVQASEKVEFTLIQCGVFSKKENAEELIGQLNKIGKSFEIEDGNKIRVFFGIYNKTEDAKAGAKLLQDNKFDENNISISVSKDNNCDIQIIDIISADLEVFNKLSDNKVKAIGTDDLKKWTGKLKKPEDNKNTEVLNELKAYIKKLPNQVTKDNINENQLFIYKQLKNLKK